MRYATFSTAARPTPRLGAVHDDEIVDIQSLPANDAAPLPGTLLALIRQGPEAWRRLADTLGNERARAAATRHPLASIRWHAPIPRPSKNIFCVGANYLSHAREGARARGRELTVVEVPVFFTKAPTTVSGPFDDIAWDRDATGQVDWEAELGVIVGTTARNVGREEALGHVFGYTVINDLTGRDVQKKHVQFFKGKSLDGFCPMGPLVVTADEFGDPQAKRLALRVNGVVKQSGTTGDMTFPVAVLLESLSLGMTLEPGDILATGTPDGVGFARTPPEFLQEGDVMETEVEGIGTMRNRIVPTVAGEPA